MKPAELDGARATGSLAAAGPSAATVIGVGFQVMDGRSAQALVRATSAGLVLLAIVVQVMTAIGAGSFDPTRFFAFFTVLSNLFGAALFLVLALRWRSAPSMSLDVLRGASVVYLTVTFIVVILLLSAAELQLAIPWVDFVLHKVFPVIVVVDWLVDPPTRRLTYRGSLRWLVFPSVWVTLTLIRGAADGWYPYPFLDPANGGYGSVAVYFVAILVGFLAIGAMTVALGDAMHDRRSRTRRPAS